LGRVGGEEFVLLLSDETAAAAMATAERLRMMLEHSWCEADGHKVKVTFSGGIAMLPAEGREWESLFAAADKRLYAAKQAGRNRVFGPTA
jgi:diguanylate cyclase (GGDEF)-like protein